MKIAIPAAAALAILGAALVAATVISVLGVSHYNAKIDKLQGRVAQLERASGRQKKQLDGLRTTVASVGAAANDASNGLTSISDAANEGSIAVFQCLRDIQTELEEHTLGITVDCRDAINTH